MNKFLNILLERNVLLPITITITITKHGVIDAWQNMDSHDMYVLNKVLFNPYPIRNNTYRDSNNTSILSSLSLILLANISRWMTSG